MKMSKKNGLKILSETQTNKLGRKYEYLCITYYRI